MIWAFMPLAFRRVISLTSEPSSAFPKLLCSTRLKFWARIVSGQTDATKQIKTSRQNEFCMAGFCKIMSDKDKTLHPVHTSFKRAIFVNETANKVTQTHQHSIVRRWWVLTFLLMTVAPHSGFSAELATAAQFRNEVQPILKEYCFDCHGDGAKKGGVAFDELTSDAVVQPELWLKVLKNTRAGLMPPRNKPRPSSANQQKLEHWIKYEAFAIDPKNHDPGRVTVRRLNRVDYRTTIRDLIGVDLNAEVEFPPDDTGYGFDNIGDVLTVSPMLLEKYLAAAKAIVSQAVPVT